MYIDGYIRTNGPLHGHKTDKDTDTRNPIAERAVGGGAGAGGGLAATHVTSLAWREHRRGKPIARSNERSEQIGVRPGAHKRQQVHHLVYRINQKPVGGDVTLPTTLIIANKSMVFVFRRERAPLNQNLDDLIKHTFVKATFPGKFQVALELVGDT